MKIEHGSINKILAGLVFLIAFTVYVFLMSPSVSFWDCGEYVAAGSTLSVPHPPGNPLYMMIARIATVLLSFIKDPAYRINLVTPFTGALSVMLAYLTIVRVFISFAGFPDNRFKMVSIYSGAFMGALFAAFGTTMLFSSVEAEVNSPLMLPIMICTWLALVWAQSRDPRRDRFLLLISYVAFLGIGIHMYSMIVLLPIFLFVVLVDREKLFDWRLWGTSIAMGLVMYSVSLFLWTGGITIAITAIMSFVEGKNQAKWRLCLGIAAVAMLGFSVHLYVPIRASLNPMINENHPSTFRTFVDYLDRKQYGSESMVTRMLWRRGTWAHQFGIEGHMGFGGFLLTQFFHFSLHDTDTSLFSRGAAAGWGKLIVYLIPLLVMLWGWFYLFRKSKNMAILLCTLTLIMTAGMVLYMNFADGTRPELRDYQAWVHAGKPGDMPTVYREVRIRDYFWVPGFFYYGMWIGIAAGCGLLALYSNRKKIVSQGLAPVMTLLVAASPVLPMTQNMGINNRRNDYIPFDYAYNMLNSVDPDGILVTNGDNDTFPLWALQEAFGIRRDVRIINLSLLNTDWYIKQLKDLNPKVPISLSDKEIETLEPQMNPFNAATPYHLHDANIDVNLPGRDRLQVMKVQDKMLVHIIDNNAWRKPIFFANTVSEDNFMGMGPYLSMEGMVYRVYKEPVSQKLQYNAERTEYLIDHVYHLRGFDSWRARHDETTQNMTSNYSGLLLQLAVHKMNTIEQIRMEISSLSTEKPDSVAEMVKAKNVQLEKAVMDAEERFEQCINLIPWDGRNYVYYAKLLKIAGKDEGKAYEKLDEAIKKDPQNIELMKLQAQTYLEKGNKKEATGVLMKLAELDVHPEYAYYTLGQIYQSEKNNEGLKWVVSHIKKINPGDPYADKFSSVD
jgi:tetratricopeptide (TPR) repeat protein